MGGRVRLTESLHGRSASTYSASSGELLEEVVLLDPFGALEEAGEVAHQAPASPRRFSRSARRARSMARGAASRLSQPCQVNWRVILVPRKPWKWMWSQAVFQSPMSGMYSIVTSVCGLVAEDLR